MTNKASEILKYAGISVEHHTENDPEKRKDLEAKLFDLQEQIGLPADEIIRKASEILAQESLSKTLP